MCFQCVWCNSNSQLFISGHFCAEKKIIMKITKRRKKPLCEERSTFERKKCRKMLCCRSALFFGAAERTKVEHSANVSRCVFFFAVCVLCDTCWGVLSLCVCLTVSFVLFLPLWFLWQKSCNQWNSVIYYLPVKMFIEFVPVLLRISLAETATRWWWFSSIRLRTQTGTVAEKKAEWRRKKL